MPSTQRAAFEGHTYRDYKVLPFLLAPPSKVLYGVVSAVEHLEAYPSGLEVMPSRQKAAKDDDAATPFHFWDIHFWNQFLELGWSSEFILMASKLTVGRRNTPILEALREFLLITWRRSVYLSFQCYMRIEHGPQWFRTKSKDSSAGRDCLQRVSSIAVWDWNGGSCLFFWRWLSDSRVWARDGHPIYVSGQLSRYRKRQAWEPNETNRE